MTNLLNKINYKDHSIIHILNSPISFFSELQTMKRFANIRTQFSQTEKVDFALFFVKRKEEVDLIAKRIHHLLTKDAVLWMAFPRKNSLGLETNISKEEGWNSLWEQSFRGIRSIGINQNWNALKFSRIKIANG